MRYCFSPVTMCALVWNYSIRFIMSSFVFIYLCVIFSFSGSCIHSFFLVPFSIPIRYPRLWFSHSKQHTSANTLNTLTFIVGVPRQPSNLFHYQWIFIEHQISTWHIIWFSYFPIFVLFFGLSAWDVRVCVCVNVFNVYMLWYRICEWESLHIYKFKR